MCKNFIESSENLLENYKNTNNSLYLIELFNSLSLYLDDIIECELEEINDYKSKD